MSHAYKKVAPSKPPSVRELVKEYGDLWNCFSHHHRLEPRQDVQEFALMVLMEKGLISRSQR